MRRCCPAHKIGSTYANRHDKKSYNVQAICDSDKRFLDVFLGNAGKIHGSQAFKRAFILEDLSRFCEYGKYNILGDAPYPLREYLLTPFRDYGSITVALRDIELTDYDETAAKKARKPNPIDLVSQDSKREKILCRLGELKRQKIARRFSRET
ncbi:hypothetical protein HPB50_014808 [Hyalomma asiaticum]|uniref:Uncharacterized protein n=1 Tax=Hyalomma asiaticum TaxID=266040 RepID=A0ACB7SFE9_HYAAI|nr:hypothetical protein HPB50_014808 [Hyalomma asiaticum]